MAGIVVAIDGPSGSGKSSTAKSIAIRANWNYLDTGALYRAATWIALKENVSEGWEIISAIKNQPIRFSSDPKDPKIFCGDVDVTDEIRGARITDSVSQISQIQELRAFLVDMQQTIINNCETGIVVEGRDIGTVVVPDADLKVFLYADLQARTMRREAEEIVADKPIDVAASLNNRDLIDSTRKISPLRPAEDALELDSTELDLKEVVEVIDTGGWEVAPEGISEKITAGSEAAIAESDIVLFVIDSQVGALDEDESLVSLLRKSKKKVIVAANKVDGPTEEADAHALWNLGFGEPRFVSALHGRGSGDLLDYLVKELPEIGSEKADDGFRRIALVGRPNVGKSSLLNILAGESRVIVDDVAGTTRDPVDELIEIGGSTWRFIDTAGIRKRARQDSGTDYYASLRTATALERAEVAVVVLDASVPLTEQDLRIVSMVEEAGRGLVIVMNKWDLVDEERQLQLDKELERNLERFPWAQRVNVSAKTGWHRDRLAPALRTAISSWEKRVPTSKLNSFLGALIAATPPPVRSGKQPKIRFATQAAICPPKFVVFASEFVETAYRRFIERRLREEFGFPGTPVEVVVKVKERD